MNDSIKLHVENDKKIIFISSYPKSGNTWLRCIISALLNNQGGKFKFDDLKKIGLFSRESHFKHFKNLQYQENGNLDFNFVSNHWIKAQQKINLENEEVKFFKSHSVRKISDRFFTDETVCLGFIYIVRDPRDVAISYTHHCGGNLDVAIDTMLFNEKNYSSRHKTNELISTWEYHLFSWNKFNTVPRLFIKYEDMLEDTKKILLQIIDFINNLVNSSILQDGNLIENVLSSTNFNYLQSLEKNIGFKFKEETNNVPFFRKGVSNQWKSVLSYNQLNLIENELATPMKHLGYLS